MAGRSTNLLSGTWDWEIGPDILRGDAGLADVFGIADRVQDGLPRSAFTSRIHPDDRVQTEVLVARAVEKCGDYSATYRVQRAEGGYRWVHARGACISIGRGPERFPGTVVDVGFRGASDVVAALTGDVTADLLLAAHQASKALDDRVLTYLVEAAMMRLASPCSPPGTVTLN